MARSRETVLKNIKTRIPSGSRLLVAVSGGLDSVSLLAALCQLQRLLKVNLEVAHVDHGVRKGSAADASFVDNLCKDYDVPFHCLTLNGPPAGENLEAWARRERYSFFSRLLEFRDLEYAVTAHTADDVAETFLMRLISNKEPRPIVAVDQQRKLLRPLLTVTRFEVETFAKSKQLRWVEDETNADTNLLRNRVRHEVIPLLRQKFDPRISEVLAIRAASWSEDDDFLNAIVEPSTTRLCALPFESLAFLSAVQTELELLPRAVHWRLIEQLFKPALGFSLGRAQAAEVLKALLVGRAEIVFGEKVVAIGPAGVAIR